MDISIVICSANRAERLRRMLVNIARLRIPAGVRWELVIVDNNSTDQTADVIAEAARMMPVVTAMEPVRGVAAARNRALQVATGRWMLCTDDDCLVCEEWLIAYWAAITENPDVGIFGGPVRPLFIDGVPNWLGDGLKQIESAFAVCDFGPVPRPLDHHAVPVGANYAVRRDIIGARLYDTDLGYAPGRTMGGEETEMLRHFFAEGVRGLYVPRAAIEHMIPASRTGLDVIAAYYRGVGQLMLRQQPLPPDQPLLFGRPRWLWRTRFERELAWRFAWATRRPASIWLRAFREAAEAAGMLTPQG